MLSAQAALANAVAVDWQLANWEPAIRHKGILTGLPGAIFGFSIKDRIA